MTLLVHVVHDNAINSSIFKTAVLMKINKILPLRVLDFVYVQALLEEKK